MSGALQRCLEECLKLITLSVIGNRFAVVAVEIRPPPARTKIGPLACYVPYVRKHENLCASTEVIKLSSLETSMTHKDPEISRLF